MYRKNWFPLLTLFLLLDNMSEARAETAYWPDGPTAAHIALWRVIESPAKIASERGFWKRLARVFSLRRRPGEFHRPLGLDARNGLVAVADPDAGGVHLLDTRRGEYRFLESAMPPEYRTPTDAAVGNEGVYVTYSTRPVVEVFDYNGKPVRTIKPRFEVGRFVGITCLASGLAVVDVEKHRTVVMDYEGKLLKSIGERGENEGTFNYPSFVTVARSGDLLVTDAMNFRVQAFAPDGRWRRSFGSRGIMSGQMNRPKGIATDPQDNLYVVDASFDNVQIFSPGGEFLLSFGSHGQGAGEFTMPTDVAADGNLLYISDTMNRRIQVFRVIRDE